VSDSPAGKLSAHSRVLKRFAGRNGRVGLHGTNQPGLIGSDVSHRRCGAEMVREERPLQYEVRADGDLRGKGTFARYRGALAGVRTPREGLTFRSLRIMPLA